MGPGRSEGKILLVSIGGGGWLAGTAGGIGLPPLSTLLGKVSKVSRAGGAEDEYENTGGGIACDRGAGEEDRRGKRLEEGISLKDGPPAPNEEKPLDEEEGVYEGWNTLLVELFAACGRCDGSRGSNRNLRDSS